MPRLELWKGCVTRVLEVSTGVTEGIRDTGSGSFYDSVPIYKTVDRTSTIGPFFL